MKGTVHYHSVENIKICRTFQLLSLNVPCADGSFWNSIVLHMYAMCKKWKLILLFPLFWGWTWLFLSLFIYVSFATKKKLLFSCKKNIVFLEQKIFSGLFFTYIFSLYLSCWNHACSEILVFFKFTCRLFLLRTILKNSLKLSLNKTENAIQSQDDE